MNMKAFIGAVSIALSAFFGNAQANDVKGYNGSYCQPYNGDQAGQFFHYSRGTLNKSFSVSGYVTCPVLQEILLDEGRTPYNSGTFQIRFHWSGSGTTSCTFYSMNYDGSIRQSVFASGGPGNVYMPNITTDDSIGSYTLFCRLPPRGILNTIIVNERS